TAKDAFLATFERSDGELRHQREYSRRDAARRLDDALERTIADFAWSAERQRAQQTANQPGEILVVSPRWEGEGLEATHQLLVGSKRVARLLGAYAYERDPQFVPQEAKHIQESRLFSHRARL